MTSYKGFIEDVANLKTKFPDNYISKTINEACKITAILIISIPCGFYLCILLLRIFS